MELVNRTPLAAEAIVSELDELVPRIGLLIAKATFRFDLEGRVELERDDPLPVLLEDEETELGLLPRDTIPRTDPAFEVILLGEALAPEGRPTGQMHVTLGLGSFYRHLLVTGDRWWRIQLDAGGDVVPSGCVPTAPEPFLRMPLTWARAWGGEAEVLIDRESPVQVTEPMNPEGKGFDPEPGARQLVQQLGAPDGYPVIERVRALPNVEDPERPVARWDDRPPPAGWATLPLTSPVRALAAFPPDRIPDEGTGPGDPPPLPPELLHRAHPDWALPFPEEGAPVFLRGLVPGAYEVSFPLPSLRVLADYVAGEREGTRELRPDVLVLLPAERRFYLVYRLVFHYEFDPTKERCFRLRTEAGWHPSE